MTPNPDAPPAHLDLDARADPEILPVLGLVPPIDLTGDLPAARAASAEARRPLMEAIGHVEGVSRRDVVVPGHRHADGTADPDVRVRVYGREPGAALPDPTGAALLYVHGGGMVLMDVDDADFICERIVADVGCAVVSVDYRLAPEDPYPAAVHDCHAALVWLHGAAEELGVESDRIAVGGHSAGGGLAAGLAILARDRAEVPICFQWLIYPMLDDRDATPSARAATDPRVWNRTSNRVAWRAYLGDAAGGPDVPLPAAPARATPADLVGLPPAYLDVGELDAFRDEDVAYAGALWQAGVACELHVTPGAFHASESYHPGAPTSRRIHALRTDALRRALGPR